MSSIDRCFLDQEFAIALVKKRFAQCLYLTSVLYSNSPYFTSNNALWILSVLLCLKRFPFHLLPTFWKLNLFFWPIFPLNACPGEADPRRSEI